MSTIVTPKASIRAAVCARGEYQAGLLNGWRCWAGTDLRGEASRWGGRYRDSRDALVARLREAGLKVDLVGAGRRTVVAVMTKTERRRVGERSVVEVAQAIVDRADRAKEIAELKAARAVRREARELAQDIPALMALV